MYRIAVTNRHLCAGDFLQRIQYLSEGDEYDAILLREKDLTHEEYEELARKVLKITNQAGKKCILHTDYHAACDLNHPYVHIPLSVFENITEQDKKNLYAKMKEISTSVHSFEQLEQAEKYGVDFVIAGHIFATDCKKGLPPRGLSFLKNICAHSNVPVYAIGGMTRKREPEVLHQGASGICIMSGCMRG